MFKICDGKIFKDVDGKNMVGVNIKFNQVSEIKDTKVKSCECRKFTIGEIKRKFQITECNPYLFPLKKKEEVKSDATTKTKKVSGKSK